MALRAISPDEVKLHNTEKDCWIIVHGKVYDVSKYLNDHPGGVEIVTDLAGMDATADYDDVGHTQEAHEILEKFVIGKVSGSAAAPTPTPVAAATPVKEAPKPATNAAPAPKPTQAPVTKPKQAPQEDSSMTMIAGVAIAAIAAGLLLYRRSVRA